MGTSHDKYEERRQAKLDAIQEATDNGTIKVSRLSDEDIAKYAEQRKNNPAPKKTRRSY